MNKIVRDHYPVDKLPEDLREGFPAHTTVRVILETVAPVSVPGLPSSLVDETPLSLQEALESIQRFKATHRPDRSPDEAVEQIRKLRDEWEGE